MSLTKVSYSMITGAPVNVKDCGATGDGVTNDSPAFALALTAVAATGQAIYVPAGTYKLSSVLSTTGNLIMYGDGQSSVLDFSGITSASSGITVTGSVAQIQSVTTANAGNLTVTFGSAPSLTLGDVFCLFDSSVLWNSIRSYYYSGEWCECRSTSGNNAYITNPLYDGYTAATVKAYKLTSPKVYFSNLKIKGGANITGLLKLTFCDKPIIENVVAYTENYQAIEIDRCYRASVTNCMVYNKGTGSSDDYGLVIGNSQKVRVTGGDYYSRRHGITIGGGDYTCAVPNRDVRIAGVTISNDVNSQVYAADMHGNIQDLTYSNCTIYQGGAWGGMDNGYDNCKIYSFYGGMCIYSSEVKGGDLFARNCDFVTGGDPSAIGRGIIDVGGNNSALTSSTDKTLSVIVENCYVRANAATAATDVVKVVNDGSTAYVNTYIDGLRGDMNAAGSILRTAINSGSAYSQAIVVDNISNFPSGTALHTAQGGAYASKPQRMMRQSGTADMTATSGTKGTVNSGITYHYSYPKTPVAACVVGGETGSFTNSAGENIGVGNYAVSDTAIRPALVSTSNANWTATATVTVNWSVGIEEI